MADPTNGLSSVGTISLVDKETNIAHYIQTSNEVTFNPNITQEVIYATSELGIEQPVKVRTTREDPTVQITFPRKSLTGISFAVGRKWETVGISNCRWVRAFLPTRTEYTAQLTGFEGFGVTIDPANALASAMFKDVAEPLTRVAFGTAGTALAGTKQYAIGANGALKISADVVGNPITLDVPYTLNSIYELSENYYKKLRLCMTLNMDDNKLVQLEFNEAIPVLDNNSLNFAEGGVQATFRSLLTGESCVSYQMRFLDLKRKC